MRVNDHLCGSRRGCPEPAWPFAEWKPCWRRRQQRSGIAFALSAEWRSRVVRRSPAARHQCALAAAGPLQV